MALVSAQTPSRLQLVAGANATFFAHQMLNISAYYGPRAGQTMNPPFPPTDESEQLQRHAGRPSRLAEAASGAEPREMRAEPLRAGVPSLEYWLDVNA